MSSTTSVSSLSSTDDLCASFPCQNGGICQSWNSNYWCYCRADYQGVNCDIPAKLPEFTTLAPVAITDTYTPNAPVAVWLVPVMALIVSIIIIITIVCSLVIAKKRKSRQRDQQLCYRRSRRFPRSIRENIHSNTRVSRLTSLSERVSHYPTSRHPSNVRFARRHNQTSTEHIFLTDCGSSHISPQQPHFYDNRESRLDGGSVNDGYDHITDLPPTYLSVVTEPTYIRDESSCLQLPPSYDAVAAIRPTPAPSDGPVTSAGVSL